LQQAPGVLCVPSRAACRAVVRFTIERDGAISKLIVEQLEFETPSKAMPFSDFMRRDVEAGKIEEITIAGQKVSGICGAAKEP
jgi:hypothetical protein